ncbi:ferritin family protein [Candidatus Woesearchaeota archaeon]|nr:ferritin family protein [Candidatus Woesearchaeota archaeon]
MSEEETQKLKQILESAIKKEEYSYQIYMRAIDMTEVDSVKTLLQKLADQELLHKEKLETLDFNKIGERVIPEKIGKIDVAEELMMTPLEEFGSLSELFKFAMKKEVEAREMYKQLAESVDDENVKKLFGMLSEEEENHRQILLDTMKEIGL